MSVYDARYRRIIDKNRPPTVWSAAITMSLFEIRRGLRGTWPKVPLILGGFIIFGFLIQLTSIDAATSTGKEFWKGLDIIGPGGEVISRIGIQPSVALLLTPMDGPGSLIIIHVAVISAGLIAGDLRDRAIDLYFSKISLRAYFLSKLIASMALTFIGMPGFTVLYFIIVVYKRWPPLNEYLLIADVLWRMLLTVFIVTLVFSTIILVFSTITENPVNAGVMFVVFTLASRVIFESILYEATKLDIFYVLSPTSALDAVRRLILFPDDISDQFGILSIFSLLGYISASILFVYYRLRREKMQ